MRQNELPYISEWIGFWSDLSNRTADKWFTVADEARRRRYTPGKMFSDVIDFWTGATIGWWTAMSGQKIPILYFQLIPTTNTVCDKSIPVYLPSLPTVSDAQKVWLGSIGEEPTPDKSITLHANNLRVWLDKDNQQILVRLVDLAHPSDPQNPKPEEVLACGTYQAFVRMAEELVGVIYINVA